MVCGGERVIVDFYFRGYFVSFCIFVNCEDYMIVVREEVFGFVMFILIFDLEEEVIRRVNDLELGLVGGIFIRYSCR